MGFLIFAENSGENPAMGRKKKLLRFAELLDLPNVVENPNPLDPKLIIGQGLVVDLKGKWAREFFKNENPITLELACGRGEYTIALARQYPERNFIGVDVKGARMWKGARAAISEGLDNAGFLRTRIECIDQLFGPGEVSEIWITFPDPFPKKTKANRRVTSPGFLNKYRKIIATNGILHLKTDDLPLFEYSREIAESGNGWTVDFYNEDIYAGELPLEELAFKTTYEGKHLQAGKTIKYLRLLPRKS